MPLPRLAAISTLVEAKTTTFERAETIALNDDVGLGHQLHQRLLVFFKVDVELVGGLEDFSIGTQCPECREVVCRVTRPN